MRILIVCTVPTEASGIPNVIFNLLKGADWMDDEIGYVAINDPSITYKEFFTSQNIKLYVLKRSIRSFFKYIKGLANIAKKYEIIHVHGNSSTMILEMIAARIAGIKVRIAHSHNTSCSNRFLNYIMNPAFQILCNKRIACGQEAGRWLFGRREFTLINNGIDSEKYQFSLAIRNNLRRDLNLSNEIIIGHVGNFVDQKNHDFVIEIFNYCYSHNNNIVLFLLGEGPLKQDIIDKVDRLGLSKNVRFIGSVNNVSDYLSAMDILLMPSKFEGLPLSLIEAQANGLPILAADTITKDANISGFIHYLPLNIGPESWTKKIFSIISVNAHNEHSSQSCIQYIKQAGYDITKIALQLRKYYVQSLEKFNS